MGNVIRMFRDPERSLDAAILRRLRRQRDIRWRLAERRRKKEERTP